MLDRMAQARRQSRQELVMPGIERCLPPWTRRLVAAYVPVLIVGLRPRVDEASGERNNGIALGRAELGHPFDIPGHDEKRRALQRDHFVRGSRFSLLEAAPLHRGLPQVHEQRRNSAFSDRRDLTNRCRGPPLGARTRFRDLDAAPHALLKV